MYQDKLAVAIKHNGKILRENKDLVQLPFGSEFSVLVKNLNSRRVKFSLHIDGTDVLGGTDIIVNANSEIEMKRFIRNGNMNEGNAFKFIERSESIENGPRGIKVDDGVVRVEFWFEKEPEQVVDTVYRYRNEYYWDTPRTFTSSILRGGSTGPQYSSTAANTRTKGISRGSAQNTVGDLQNTAFTADTKTLHVPTANSSNIDAAGITVPGSKVEQKFTTVYGFNSESHSHVIVLRLVGRTSDNVEVAKPVTVKTKKHCQTCGSVNKPTFKFCTKCGTSLEII